MSESFLVHYILNTFPQKYKPFKISYNRHKDKWSINKLLTMCVQEKMRLIMDWERVHLWQYKERTRIKPNRKGKARYLPKLKSRRNLSVSSAKRRDTLRRIVSNFKNSLRRNVIQSHLFVLNIIWYVNHNTWRIDSGSIIHITNSL